MLSHYTPSPVTSIDRIEASLANLVLGFYPLVGAMSSRVQYMISVYMMELYCCYYQAIQGVEL